MITERGNRTLADWLNNPGNIRLRDPWHGLVLPPPHDEFCGFSHVIWGWRAMFRIVTDDFDAGYSIADVITEWAPPEENDTQRYIDAVLDIARLNNSDITLTEPSSFRRMVIAMAIHEGFPRHRIHAGDVMIGQMWARRDLEFDFEKKHLYDLKQLNSYLHHLKERTA